MKIIVCETPEMLTARLCSEWERAGSTDGLILSGGSTFTPLYETAPPTPAHLFLADERAVAPDAQESTQHLIRQTYLARSPNTPFTAPDTTKSLAETVTEYNAALHAWEAAGNIFKTAFLGIGIDGHLASLFPKQFAGIVDSPEWVVAAEAEFPPIVHRVTVTPIFLNRVTNLIFVATGDRKRDIVRQIIEKEAPLPVTHFREQATFYLDAAAAADIPSTRYEQH